MCGEEQWESRRLTRAVSGLDRCTWLCPALCDFPPTAQELPRSMSDLKIPQGQEPAQEILKEIASKWQEDAKEVDER